MLLDLHSGGLRFVRRLEYQDLGIVSPMKSQSQSLMFKLSLQKVAVGPKLLNSSLSETLTVFRILALVHPSHVHALNVSPTCLCEGLDVNVRSGLSVSHSIVRENSMSIYF